MILVTPQPSFLPLLRQVQDLELVSLIPQFTTVMADTDI